MVVGVGLAACGKDVPTSEAVQKRVDALEARVSALESKGGSPGAGRTATSSPPAPPPITDAARKTLEALKDNRLTVDFTNAPVKQVIQLLLAQMEGTSVIVSSSVDKMESTVSLKLTGVSTYDALNLLASQSTLRWNVHESGALQITTAEPVTSSAPTR
jgi:hypothetical protein